MESNRVLGTEMCRIDPCRPGHGYRLSFIGLEDEDVLAIMADVDLIPEGRSLISELMGSWTWT